MLTFFTLHNVAQQAYALAAGLARAEFLSAEQTRRMTNDSRHPSLFYLFHAKMLLCAWSSDPAAAMKHYASDDAAPVQP
jgi:hypothetical protein